MKPVSVFDPLSAKMAEENGCDAIQLAGSVAANVLIGAPDLMLVTLDEFSGLTRRIARGRNVPLIVDADHGFGNALSAIRCVEELTDAGVSGITLEDTVLPAKFSSPGTTVKGSAGGFELTSIEEHVGKLNAAVAAKTDPSLVVIARTSAFACSGVEELCSRIAAYSVTGVDALHFIGSLSEDDFREVKKAANGLPLMVSGAQGVPDAELPAQGVVLKLEGHKPFLSAQKAAYDAIHGNPDVISSEDLGRLLEVQKYRALQKNYLHISNPAEGMK